MDFFLLMWSIEMNPSTKYEVFTSYRTLSSLLMNDTTIVLSYTRQFRLRAATTFYRMSMELKIRFFINVIQLDFASPRTHKWVKVLPTSDPTESLDSDQPVAKQSFFIRQVHLFWDSSRRRYFHNLVTKERFCDEPDLSTLSRALVAMKTHASTNGVLLLRYPILAVDWIKWIVKKLWKYSVKYLLMLTCIL